MGVGTADARQCISMMDSGRLCAVTNTRSRWMSPLPTRAGMVRALTTRFRELGVTKASVANEMADAAVDICQPQLNTKSCGGKSLLDMMYDEAFHLLDTLAMEDDNDLVRGQLQEACYFIAVVENPYKPSMPAVKARIVKQWQEEQEDGD